VWIAELVAGSTWNSGGWSVIFTVLRIGLVAWTTGEIVERFGYVDTNE